MKLFDTWEWTNIVVKTTSWGPQANHCPLAFIHWSNNALQTSYWALMETNLVVKARCLTLACTLVWPTTCQMDCPLRGLQDTSIISSTRLSAKRLQK